jgi:hypothetical protein
MTDKPEIIIEEYLALVNEHLPESISEDVITELRSYMVETARETGGGEITQQSAKKVVAHFGAPSEVAREYRYSMLPETIPPEEAAPVEQSVIIEEPESHKREVRSYSGAYLQAGAITIGWALIIASLSTLLGPIWMEGMVTTILVSQVTVVLVGIGVITYSRKRNNEILLSRSYPEWPRMQKLLTLPDNYINDSVEQFSTLDILGSFLGFAIFFASTSPFAYLWYVLIIAIPTCMLFVSKMIIGIVRRNTLDPTKRLHGEFIVTFGSLLFLDCSLIWFAFRWMGTYNPWSPFVLMYAIAWGPVLLFQLVVRGQNLYWDKPGSSRTDSPPLSKQETDIILRRVGKNRNSTIARIVGWIVVFCVVPVYCYIISEGTASLSYSNSIVPLTLFLGPLYIIPVITYFLFRHFRISTRKSRTVFGVRSRPEAVVDLIGSSILLIGFSSSLPYMLSSSSLTNLYRLVVYDLGETGAQYFATGYFGVYFLLIAGLTTRIIGNILEFRESKKNTASELITASGTILLFAISMRFGIDILTYNVFLFSMAFYPFVLVGVVMLAFQIETTRLKLRENKRKLSEDATRRNEQQKKTIESASTQLSRHGSNYPS